MANKMDLENTFLQREKLKLVNGLKVKEFIGLLRKKFNKNNLFFLKKILLNDKFIAIFFFFYINKL